MPTLPPAIWDAIERHWCLGSYSVEALSRRFGVDDSTIHYHARIKKWPKRASQRGDVGLTLRAQSDDLWRELSEASMRLRGTEPPEDPAQARDRLALIRLWQRSMTALRGFEIAELEGGNGAKVAQILFTKTDADAVVKRMQRLVADTEEPPAPPAS